MRESPRFAFLRSPFIVAVGLGLLGACTSKNAGESGGDLATTATNESTGTSGGSTSSAESSAGESGPPSLAGAGPCAAFTTQDDCLAAGEVEPGAFCRWRHSAVLPIGAADCAELVVGEGCFTFPDPGGDPGCVSSCENPDFYRPFYAVTETETVVVGTCTATEPYGFEFCKSDLEILACQCACAAEPGDG